MLKYGAIEFFEALQFPSLIKLFLDVLNSRVTLVLQLLELISHIFNLLLRRAHKLLVYLWVIRLGIQNLPFEIRVEAENHYFHLHLFLSLCLVFLYGPLEVRYLLSDLLVFQVILNDVELFFCLLQKLFLLWYILRIVNLPKFLDELLRN